jgi:hypothetical protein
MLTSSTDFETLADIHETRHKRFAINAITKQLFSIYYNQ